MASNTKKAGIAVITAALISSVVAFTAPFEGKRNVAYWDPFGHVWTVCYGETKNVHKGDHYTDDQCLQKLALRIGTDFGPPVDEALSHRIPLKPVPDKVRVAFIDFTYNLGVGAFNKSSIVRKWNAGDSAGACHALRLYNKAGGQVLKGLETRRKAEEKLCLEGVAGK